MPGKDTLLKIVSLTKYFETPYGLLHAVDNLTFDIKAGETLGVVGESGCGKSTLGRCILQLIKPTAGEIYFEGEEILRCGKQELKKLRTKMQIIFQDPYSSLNPRMTVAQSIEAPLLLQGLYHKRDRAAIDARVCELMDLVGLAKRFVNSYPHELDGGRRQRIGIARALSLNPKFNVCDEPVSDLDVSIQAQKLNLMQQLQAELGLTYMFITHDLSVVKHISDNIVVMYLGQFVERGTAEALFKNPRHPYTKALLSAIPIPDPDFRRDMTVLKGELSSPINVGAGCRFAKRCPDATSECGCKELAETEVEPGHFVLCNKYL